MNEYIIETYNLEKKYKKQKAVDNMNLKIKPGTIYGLLGKNGAGKTTLMCMLLKLTKKTKGKAYIFGYDNDDENEKIYNKVGSIIEIPGFYSNLTGYENLKLFSKLQKNSKEENILKVLEIVGLTDHKNKLFKNYSLGMKQRLAIGLALLKEPDLLILDEPINGLDPVGIIEIRKLLKKLSDEFGITILISSHILSEIEQLADVIGIVKEGKLIKEITISELHDNINTYTIFQTDDVKKASAVFKKLGLEKYSDFSIADDKSIHLHNHLDLTYKINRSLVESDINVYEITNVKENLEEYFINIIGD